VKRSLFLKWSIIEYYQVRQYLGLEYMNWIKKFYNSRFFEDMANHFDPYNQEIERILASEKLKRLEDNKQGEQK